MGYAPEMGLEEGDSFGAIRASRWLEWQRQKPSVARLDELVPRG
jgi:hypothetical protein